MFAHKDAFDCRKKKEIQPKKKKESPKKSQNDPPRGWIPPLAFPPAHGARAMKIRKKRRRRRRNRRRRWRRRRRRPSFHRENRARVAWGSRPSDDYTPLQIRTIRPAWSIPGTMYVRGRGKKTEEPQLANRQLTVFVADHPDEVQHIYKRGLAIISVENTPFRPHSTAVEVEVATSRWPVRLGASADQQRNDPAEKTCNQRQQKYKRNPPSSVERSKKNSSIWSCVKQHVPFMPISTKSTLTDCHMRG